MSEPQHRTIWDQAVSYVLDIFRLDNINYKQSIADIKAEVSFKGFNIYILISSILICSLGLNMNSTAVVIGAMLISPLMGPIVGLGLGIGIFDRKLIYRSLNNLGIAAGISILTAFIFFKFTPTKDVPEILARTSPTILDLFVAFFGGFAGILAAAKCLKSNVVPGVAIATALMPPLCTAGYGLASGNMDYFAGALYLFLMNSIMISFAALLVVLYLRYPKFSFVDETMKRRVRNGIIIVVILITGPSVYFYYNLLQTNLRNDRIELFVEQQVESIPGVYVTNQKIFQSDSTTVIYMDLRGVYLDKDDSTRLAHKLADYSLEDCELSLGQIEPVGLHEQRIANLKTDIITELYENSSRKLESKDDEIEFLKLEIEKLSSAALVSNKVTKMARSQYDIHEMAVDILVFNDGAKSDTVPTALVAWKKDVRKDDLQMQSKKLEDLIKIELGTSHAKVINYTVE